VIANTQGNNQERTVAKPHHDLISVGRNEFRDGGMITPVLAATGVEIGCCSGPGQVRT